MNNRNKKEKGGPHLLFKKTAATNEKPGDRSPLLGMPLGNRVLEAIQSDKDVLMQGFFPFFWLERPETWRS